MRVKVFRFKVSNWTSSAFESDKEKSNYYDSLKELVSEHDIEESVNSFITDKEVVSITVTPVDVHYHNNGRGNDIDLVYTILYK